jgi:hypothetical protein
MKKLGLLSLLLMLIVSCGGGADGGATNTPMDVNSNATAFEQPPIPGGKR